MSFAYYDPAADIAWFPTSESDDVISERVTGGLRDYDRETRELVAIEVWEASTRLPKDLLEALPAPNEHEAPNARIVIDDEPAADHMARLPERWRRFDSGRPVGDIVTALDRSREGR